MLDLDDFGWTLALELAQSGDSSELRRLLSTESNVPERVSVWLCDVIDGKAQIRRPPGIKPRLNFAQRQRIGLINFYLRSISTSEKATIIDLTELAKLGPRRVRELVRAHRRNHSPKKR